MERRCLILDFDQNSKVASCFYKESLELLLIKIRNGESPSPGKFLIYTPGTPGTDETDVLKPETLRIESAKKDDCVMFDNEGNMHISSWISFSPNPNHRTFDRKVAFADWYGFVECPEELLKKWPTSLAFKSFIVLKDLDYKRKQTQLFKVVLIKGPINCTTRTKKDYDDLMSNMNRYEDSINGSSLNLNTPEIRAGSVVPERPSRSIDEQIGRRIGKTNKSRSRSRNSKKRAVKPNEFPISPNLPRLMASLNTDDVPAPIIPVPRETRQILPIAPPSSSTASVYHDRGLVMCQETDDRFIIWLMNLKQTAVLNGWNLGNVRNGVAYEFNITPIMERNTVYEITEIGKKLETLPFQIYETGDVTVAGLHVDLCSPNTKCQTWSFYMGTPFFNSSDVGIVTMADFIDTPLRKKQRWQESIRDYLGDPRAKSMKCICRLIEQKVPSKMMNPFESDEFRSVSKYTWQIVEVRASEEHDKMKEYQLTQKNLGSYAKELEEEDEIARLKRENRDKVRFGPNQFRLFESEPSSSLVDFSSQY